MFYPSDQLNGIVSVGSQTSTREKEYNFFSCQCCTLNYILMANNSSLVTMTSDQNDKGREMKVGIDEKHTIRAQNWQNTNMAVVTSHGNTPLT